VKGSATCGNGLGKIGEMSQFDPFSLAHFMGFVDIYRYLKGFIGIYRDLAII
jgi:GTP-dependent phosphoenolpyruvate carboxykinase